MPIVINNIFWMDDKLGATLKNLSNHIIIDMCNSVTDMNPRSNFVLLTLFLGDHSLTREQLMVTKAGS